jgi:two-component system, cell cycle sensor histidine kinase and response regulator CckA
MAGFLPRTAARDISSMSIENALPWREPSPTVIEETSFAMLFENAPIRVARCNREGLIRELNPAFERTLNGVAFRCLHEAATPGDRNQIDAFLKNIFDSGHATARIHTNGSNRNEAPAKWVGWLQPGIRPESSHALIFVDPQAPTAENPDESLFQAGRWEAIGRLTGGVVHDFNNLLTGVMLYSDLMLSSFDSRDCRRRYAEEIRSAVVQASGLVQQLLVFARPEASPSGPLNFNDIAEGMCDLLNRLIGDNIVLDLRLDRELGEVEIPRSQAQQVLLNLVLNARDALPHGGRITIETSNCSFQPLGACAQTSAEGLDCVLLAVGDNGCGMSAETRRRLFEPFFTTKTGGGAGGLGLTTVHAIVTTNRGLIHFESEAGRGTRAMMLFPRNIPCGRAPLPERFSRSLQQTSASPLQAVERECAL